MIRCPQCGSPVVLGVFDDETYDGERIFVWEYANLDSDDPENVYSYFECEDCGHEWEVIHNET